MKTYTDIELKEIIQKHWKWLNNQKDGERADLSSANLRYADLSYADLRSADLSSANLSYANLSSANLSSANLSYANLSSANLSSANLRYADLSYADLSSANLRYANLSYANLSYANLSETILSGINWLAYIGIVPGKNGKARAYKVITSEGNSPTYSGINYLESKIVEGDSFDNNPDNHCSHGVNLATLQWALNNKGDQSNRLLLMEFVVSPENVCTPRGTDGKFRVKQATRIGECDWNGNLLTVKKGGKVIEHSR